MVSSAYSTSLKLVQNGCEMLRFRRMMCLTSYSSTVIQAIKRYGDSGQPCLMPVRCSYQLDCCPSSCIRKVGVAYRLLMMSIMSAGMLSRCSD